MITTYITDTEAKIRLNRITDKGLLDLFLQIKILQPCINIEARKVTSKNGLFRGSNNRVVYSLYYDLLREVDDSDTTKGREYQCVNFPQENSTGINLSASKSYVMTYLNGILNGYTAASKNTTMT